MAPRKAKHPALDDSDEDAAPHRRSSLQVNLSYVSNLSDSGNGSFRSTQPENTSRNSDKPKITLRRNRLSKIAESSTLEDTILSAIKQRESVLSQSCEILKDAIMNKTREIFDGGAELAVKTATVLKGQRQALREINEDSPRRVEGMALNNVTMRKRDSRIVPKKSEGHSRNSLKSPLKISAGKSPILSGSRKLRGNWPKLNKVLRVRLTRLSDPRLEISMNSSQSSHQNSMNSSCSDIGAPITCSSFIVGDDNRTQLAEKDSTESSSPTTMEITAIQGHAKSSKSLASNNRDDDAIRGEKTLDNHASNDETVPMELTDVQSHIIPANLSSREKTNRTSLNVNTSVSSSTSILRNSRQSLEKKNSQSNVEQSPEISLRVNTSLESEKQESMKNSTDLKNPENPGIRSDSDSCEEMSLIARLRNISDKRNRSKHSTGSEGPSFVEGTPFPPSRSMLWKTQIRSETLNAKKNRTIMKLDGSNDKAKDGVKDASEILNYDSSTSEERATPPNDTVIIGNTPSRIVSTITNPRIIEDSSNEIEEYDEQSRSTSAEMPIPNESTTSSNTRMGKKKLLPLTDKYELVSFSPASAEPTPKRSMSWKPRKKFRKFKNLRAVAEKRIEESRRDDDDDDDDDNDENDDDLSRSNIAKIKKGKVKKPRKIVSKKIIVVKKAVEHDFPDRFEDPGQTSMEQSINGQRSSINEFTQRKKVPTLGRNSKPQKLSIVATGFSKGDVDLVKSVVKELGGAEISSTVSRRTTHVVSTGVRTINLLRGIIRGCWMISLEWVLKSLERKKWLDPERYEMVHFSKAVQENRRDKQIFGRAYVPELFTTCGPIYIEAGTSPPPEILKELIKTAGGRIAENSRDARLNVGSGGLREIWILDSITTGDLQPIDEYRKK